MHINPTECLFSSVINKMALSLQAVTLPMASFNYRGGNSKCRVLQYVDAQHVNRAKTQCREMPIVLSALPETTASIAVAATVVGAAATLLFRRTKSSEATEASVKICDDCGGSGVCSECKGEGFVLKRLPEESAEKARSMAKNMATRYTAGLPKKWSYCTKCSSARSCSTCGGSGKLTFQN